MTTTTPAADTASKLEIASYTATWGTLTLTREGGNTVDRYAWVLTFSYFADAMLPAETETKAFTLFTRATAAYAAEIAADIDGIVIDGLVSDSNLA
jgi:hypothetical protein